jgi:hypothetical protein
MSLHRSLCFMHYFGIKQVRSFREKLFIHIPIIKQSPCSVCQLAFLTLEIEITLHSYLVFSYCMYNLAISV